MKTCPKCQTEKGRDQFGKANGRKDGLKPWCRECCRTADGERRRRKLATDPEFHARHYAKKREYRAGNPEFRERQNARNRAYMKDRFHNDPEARAKMLATSAAQGRKRRAVMAGAEYVPYSRADIFARWGGRCCYCDSPAEHLDHMNPISKGGADAGHNLVPACAPCNLSKNAKTLAEWATTF